MLAVLEKASENTHFCNDIQSCNDDEVLAVGDNRCTPSNDLALMSYIIERKLVGPSNSAKKIRYLLLFNLFDLIIYNTGSGLVSI